MCTFCRDLLIAQSFVILSVTGEIQLKTPRDYKWLIAMNAWAQPHYEMYLKSACGLADQSFGVQ